MNVFLILGWTVPLTYQRTAALVGKLLCLKWAAHRATPSSMHLKCHLCSIITSEGLEHKLIVQIFNQWGWLSIKNTRKSSARLNSDGRCLKEKANVAACRQAQQASEWTRRHAAIRVIINFATTHHLDHFSANTERTHKHVITTLPVLISLSAEAYGIIRG